MNMKIIKPLSISISTVLSGAMLFMILFLMYEDFITSKIQKEKNLLLNELQSIVNEKPELKKTFANLTIPTKEEHVKLQTIVAANKYISSIAIIHDDRFVYSTFGIRDRKSTHIKEPGFYLKAKSNLTQKPILYYMYHLNEDTFIRIYLKPLKFDYLSLIGNGIINIAGIELDENNIIITNPANLCHQKFSLKDISFSVNVDTISAILLFILKKLGYLILLSTLFFFFACTLSRKIERELVKHQIKKNRVQPYLQPIVDQHNNIIGAEILARWINNDGSLVAPYLFIPYIEKELLTPLLTRSLLDQINNCDILQLTSQFKLSFNLTESCLFDNKVFTLSHQLAKKCHLVLEFTESTPFVSPDTPSKMEAYRQLGVTFAIDDYGTGFSAPHYLTEYKFDYLKIDKCFVDNINNEDPDSSYIIESIIFLAEKLKLELIAEGVEIQTQKQLLEKLGIDNYQGFLFYKPMSLVEFSELQMKKNQ